MQPLPSRKGHQVVLAGTDLWACIFCLQSSNQEGLIECLIRRHEIPHPMASNQDAPPHDEGGIGVSSCPFNLLVWVEFSWNCSFPDFYYLSPIPSSHFTQTADLHPDLNSFCLPSSFSSHRQWSSCVSNPASVSIFLGLCTNTNPLHGRVSPPVCGQLP